MRRVRLLPLAVGVAVVLLVAGLTHLTAVLLMPRLVSSDAFDRLAAHGDLSGSSRAVAARAGSDETADGGMHALGPARPGDTLVPLRDPAVVQGLCAFDLSKAPVRVRAKTDPGRLLTLSFRTREGRIFYAMTDRAALRNTIDIRLVTPAQLADIAAQDDEDQGLPEELRLQAPSLKGLVVATVLVARPSERGAADARIAAITCAPEPIQAAPS